MNKKLFFIISSYLFCFAPHMTLLPLWSTLLSGLLIGLAYLSAWTGKNYIQKPVKVLLTLALPLAVGLEFKTLLGPEPATTLLTLLVSLKLHEVNSERDEKVVLILNSTVVMCWLLFSQSLLTTGYMILALLLIGVGLIHIQAPKKRLYDILFKSQLQISYDVALAVPLFLAFFFLFPRFSTPLSNLFSNQKTQVGFSDQLTPGLWAELVQSDEVAFRVLVDQKSIRPYQMYWRGLVLTETDGFNWKRSSQRSFSAKDSEIKPHQTTPAHRVKYEIILEPRFGRTIFSLEQSHHLQFKESVKSSVVTTNSHFTLLQDVLYRTSFLGEAELTPLNQEASLQPQKSELPIELSSRFKDLLYRIKSESKSLNANDLAEAVLSHFKNQNFSYSTSTPNMTSIDDFLFTYKTGFCEHFASAFSVLMRALGHPARVVIGFQGGEYNAFGNYILVRDRNAHAWSEVYLPKMGWMRYDPTSVVNSSRIEMGNYLQPSFAGLDRDSSLARSIQAGLAYFESLNTRYILFLLNFDSETQLGFLKTMGFRIVSKYMLALALVFIFLLFLFLFYKRIYSSSRAPDRLNKAYSHIIQVIESFDIKKANHEGPLDFSKRLPTEFLIHKNLISEYIVLAYSNEKTVDLNQFVKKAMQLKSKSPLQNKG